MNQYIKTYFVRFRCSPSETGAQLGKIPLQSLLISRLEILEPPLFWLQIRMRLSAEKWIFPAGFPRKTDKIIDQTI